MRILSLLEMDKIASNICNIYHVGKPLLSINPAEKTIDGYYIPEYPNGIIVICGKNAATESTLLHELAHHIHITKSYKEVKNFHCLNFYRICFRLKRTYKKIYKRNIKNICRSETISYFKAKKEYENN